MGKPRNTRKYPTYPEIPESKKDTRKYPIVFFDTPTRPEPDPLPGILSTTRPDPILKNPTRWALVFNLAQWYRGGKSREEQNHPHVAHGHTQSTVCHKVSTKFLFVPSCLYLVCSDQRPHVSRSLQVFVLSG